MSIEYDSRPDDLIHAACEEAVRACPRLALEPYYQIKQAVRILAIHMLGIEDALKKYRSEHRMNLVAKYLDDDCHCALCKTADEALLTFPSPSPR